MIQVLSLAEKLCENHANWIIQTVINPLPTIAQMQYETIGSIYDQEDEGERLASRYPVNLKDALFIDQLFKSMSSSGSAEQSLRVPALLAKWKRGYSIDDQYALVDHNKRTHRFIGLARYQQLLSEGYGFIASRYAYRRSNGKR